MYIPLSILYFILFSYIFKETSAAGGRAFIAYNSVPSDYKKKGQIISKFVCIDKVDTVIGQPTQPIMYDLAMNEVKTPLKKACDALTSPLGIKPHVFTQTAHTQFSFREGPYYKIPVKTMKVKKSKKTATFKDMLVIKMNGKECTVVGLARESYLSSGNFLNPRRKEIVDRSLCTVHMSPPRSSRGGSPIKMRDL